MANIKQFGKILSMTREGINLLKLTLCPLPTLLGLDHVWQYEVPAYPSAKAVFLQHLHKRSPEIKSHWYPQFSPLLSPLTPWLALNFSIGSCPRFMHRTLSFFLCSFWLVLYCLVTHGTRNDLFCTSNLVLSYHRPCRMPGFGHSKEIDTFNIHGFSCEL